MKKLFITVLVLFVTSCLLLTVTSQAGTTPKPPKTAILLGKVLSPEGVPIFNASVSLYDSTHAAPYRVTYSDNKGEYGISGIKPGKYTVKVTAIGCKQIELKIILSKGKTTTEDFELKCGII